jgi:hypothetical protein
VARTNGTHRIGINLTSIALSLVAVCAAAENVACGGASCIEQATVVLLEPLAQTADACTVDISTPSGVQASYAFARWSGMDVTCAVQQGPTPQTCTRRHTTDSAGATVDAFEIFFYGQPNATDARSYFGQDAVEVTLTCGRAVVESQRPYRFECITPL